MPASPRAYDRHTTSDPSRCRSNASSTTRPLRRASATMRIETRLAVPLPDEPQPLERQLRVDLRDRLRVRRDQLGEAARRDRRRVGRLELVADPRRRSRRPGRRSRRRAPTGAPRVVVLPITRSGAVERHLRQPRRAREERVHRDLDPRREHAADVLARGRDDVEVRRRAEVDDDRRRAVALARRDRVRDPVRADLARVVVADRHAGRDAGAEHEQLGARPSARRSARTRARAAAPSTRARSRRASPESTNARSITASSSAVCAGSVPTRNCSVSAVAVEEPEDGLRVADVDREQHRGRARARGRARRRPRSRGRSCASRARRP